MRKKKHTIFIVMETGSREIRTTRAKLGIFGRNATLICEALGIGMKSNWGFQATLLNTIPNPPPALAVWEFSIPNLPTPPPTFHCIPPTLPPPLCFPSTQPTFSIRVLPLPLFVHHSASVSLSLAVIVLSLMFFCLFSLLFFQSSLHLSMFFHLSLLHVSFAHKHVHDLCMFHIFQTFHEWWGGGLHMSIYATSIVISFLISLGRISLLAFSFSDSLSCFHWVLFFFLFLFVFYFQMFCQCLCLVHFHPFLFFWFCSLSFSAPSFVIVF